MQQAKPIARERAPKTSPRRVRSPAARSRARDGGPRLAPGVVLFDRYRLDGELGHGGVADVWRARDDRLDRDVAIKILHPELLPDQGWRRRFVAEARAASALSHPGIVPVYDVFDDPETPAIVFQLVEGESLADRLARDGSIPVGEATHIAAQVAGALEHAHAAGLVHRDVKPANIVIDDAGRARLVDFGIARVVDDASAEREGREVVGTLRYMAPEQLAGEPTDARTDLYALGLVIAEMVPDLASGPDWLRELVARLRSPDPADRPSSAGDVARALETGRSEIDGDAAAFGSPAGTSAATEPPPEVDPDAVTRSYADPDDVVPERARAGADAPASVVPIVAAAAGSAPLPARHAGTPVATSTKAAPRPLPARPRGANPTANRPIVAALVLGGLLLAGFIVGRGDLFGASAGPTPSIAPVPTDSTPTTVPLAQPAGPKPGHGNGHGHGRGG